MYKLPDMNDFESYERTHIEGVVEKAEKGAFPFVIKVTNADTTVREDSLDAIDEAKFDSILNQTASNTSEPKESNKLKVLLNKPTENTSSFEKLDNQQNEEILGETVPETSAMKVQRESNLDTKADLEKNGKREVMYDISDAEMEHIRKVAEAAMMMEADNQWISWPTSGQKIVRTLQNMMAPNSLTKSKIAEELNTSKGPNINVQDVRITNFSAEGVEPEKILSAKEIICERRKQKVEESVISEADNMGDTSSLQKIPSLKSYVTTTDPFEEDLNKAKTITTDTEKMKISQNCDELETKIIEGVAMHTEELEGQTKELERFEKSISREVVETKTVNLTDEELAQIRLVNEKTKKLEESNVFSPKKIVKEVPEIQNICVVDEEKLGQTKVAGRRRIKELQAVDESFLCESKINKEKKEKDECLIKHKLMDANVSEERSKELKVEETAVAANLKENKNISFPEKSVLINSAEGKIEHLEGNGFIEKKETETVQDHNEENNTLTEEEMMQIRPVQQTEKQMEEFFILEGRQRKENDSDPTPDRLLTEDKFQNYMNEDEPQHTKELERNAPWHLEIPFLERFSTKEGMFAKINKVELQQKNVASDEITFNKFAKMLNPLKNSVIETLSFKSNVDEAKVSHNIASARDVSKANKQIMEESVKAYSENQNFKADVASVKKTDYANNDEVLVTMKDLAPTETTNKYSENQDLEYMSSSESSDFGPGASDEDVEIDQDTVKSFGLFSGTSSPTTIRMEVLPNSETKLYSQGISQNEQILGITSSPSFTSATQLGAKDNATDREIVDRFAGLTEEEIEHIKKVDLQFELENAKDASNFSMHNDENLGVEDVANFVNEMVLDIKEHEKQQEESIIDVKGAKALYFDDKVRSDGHIDMESTESEKDIVYDTNHIPLNSFTVNDKLLEQLVERDLIADQRTGSWQNAHAERDNKMKSLEELGREVDIGKWYEERLSSLRNSLCAEETAKISGFDLKLYNFTIIIA